jgi:hypothetical protein
MVLVDIKEHIVQSPVPVRETSLELSRFCSKENDSDVREFLSHRVVNIA